MINNDVEIEVPVEIMENWQEISDILAEMIDVPVALIMRFNDPEIEVFVSSQSEGNPYQRGNKEKLSGSGLYCETVIRTKSKLLVPDAMADENWKNNPDIKLNMVSYLGYPILLPDGKPFGTLCVLDNKPNEYSKKIEQLMLKFRIVIESHLELIYLNRILGDKNKKLTDYLTELQALRGMVSICSYCKKIKNNRGEWHPVEHYLIQQAKVEFSHGICPECKKKL
jgi:transcriptional regulator with GAF, ATPase, and Fis domain